MIEKTNLMMDLCELGKPGFFCSLSLSLTVADWRQLQDRRVLFSGSDIFPPPSLPPPRF